jgi:hypothetical protein
MNLTRIKTSIAGLAILGALVATVPVATVANAEGAAVTRMTLIQEKPTLFTYENLPGEVPGRKTYYAARMTKPSGEDFGLLTGNVSTIQPLQGNNPEEARLRLLVYTLPGGQIIAQGNSLYPRGAVEINPNTSIVTAITGGTGKYIGARGQVVHTRNADGTYIHKFTLLK